MKGEKNEIVQNEIVEIFSHVYDVWRKGIVNVPDVKGKNSPMVYIGVNIIGLMYEDVIWYNNFVYNVSL